MLEDLGLIAYSPNLALMRELQDNVSIAKHASDEVEGQRAVQQGKDVLKQRANVTLLMAASEPGDPAPSPKVM